LRSAVAAQIAAFGDVDMTTPISRLVEIATWEASDDIDAHRGHPWLTMRPVLETELGPETTGVRSR
jgi:hypothetical protein